MLPFLILLFCSSPETARMILIYATDESAARLQALEDFALLNDSGFAASAQTPYEWENPHGDQLFIESVYPVPSGDLSAIRRMLGDDDAPYTDKHLIAGLLEDSRRIQMIEPNAGTLSRIAQAEQYLQ